MCSSEILFLKKVNSRPTQPSFHWGLCGKSWTLSSKKSSLGALRSSTLWGNLNWLDMWDLKIIMLSFLESEVKICFDLILIDILGLGCEHVLLRYADSKILVDGFCRVWCFFRITWIGLWARSLLSANSFFDSFWNCSLYLDCFELGEICCCFVCA